MGLERRRRNTRPRFAVIGSPRAGNTWLRRLLVELFGLNELAVHTPGELDWDRLPERCVVQLHWPRVRPLMDLLDSHGFHVCVPSRHPLDTLISILHFAAHEPETARWLGGAYGDERPIIGVEPCSNAFIAYSTGPRARALIGISPQWWNRHVAARIRFERLIADPSAQLERVAAASGVQPAIEIEQAIEKLPFTRMQQESTNEHFWLGRPGLWRRLLPPTYATAIAAPYLRHAHRHRYEVNPDHTLTVEAAFQQWRALSRATSAGSMEPLRMARSLERPASACPK